MGNWLSVRSWSAPLSGDVSVLLCQEARKAPTSTPATRYPLWVFWGFERHLGLGDTCTEIGCWSETFLGLRFGQITLFPSRSIS